MGTCGDPFGRELQSGGRRPDRLGGSSRPRGFEELWIDAQAEALAAALDELGIEQTALAAHDYGGPVALTFLRRFPGRVSHLGLLSTNAFSDTPVDFPLSLLKLPLIGPLLDPVFFNGVALSALGRMASKTDGVRPDHNDGEIDIPTVVIWGDRDMFFPASLGRRTAESIPGARFVLLDGCGHFTPIERTGAVAAEITN